jgi:hypothetical protein
MRLAEQPEEAASAEVQEICAAEARSVNLGKSVLVGVYHSRWFERRSDDEKPTLITVTKIEA